MLMPRWSSQLSLLWSRQFFTLSTRCLLAAERCRETIAQAVAPAVPTDKELADIREQLLSLLRMTPHSLR